MDPDPSGSLYLSATHLLAEAGRFIPFDNLCVKLNSQCNRNQHNTKILKESPQLLFYISLFGPSSQFPFLTIERQKFSSGALNINIYILYTLAGIPA